MIRAYGSQIVCGDGGRIKIRPYNMIRAYGSQEMRLKKVSTISNHYLKHANFRGVISGAPELSRKLIIWKRRTVSSMHENSNGISKTNCVFRSPSALPILKLK